MTTARAALYLRVSTDRQSADQQESVCTAYALHAGLPIVSMFRDTTSGAVPWRQRGLQELLASEPAPTDLIVYDYSRIGRDLVDTLDMIKHCTEAGINVHTAKDGTAIRADLSGKVLSTVMALAAEIERSLLRSRTTDALAERKSKIKTEGGFTSKQGTWRTRLGRPVGSAGGSKLDDHAEKIAPLIAAGVSNAAIGRLLECDPRTVEKYRKRHLKGIKK